MECLLCTRHFRRKLHAGLGILIWMVGWGAVRAGLWDETDWAASCTGLWDQGFVDRGREDHGGGGKGALQPTREKQQRNLTWDHGDTGVWTCKPKEFCLLFHDSVCLCVGSGKPRGQSFVWILFCDSLCTCVCERERETDSLCKCVWRALEARWKGRTVRLPLA